MRKKNYSNKKERVIVILDGSNFYHRLKDKEINFTNILDFDYRGLAEWLSHGRKIIRCTYYIGLVRKELGNRKSENLVKNQQKLFAYLTSSKQKWEIETGYMMKHGSSDYKEKGVDVKMAIDILDKAHKNEYDTVVIISSDTDLIPAIVRAKELGKNIEYIGFAHRPSFGMQRYVTISRLLTKFELQKFVNTDKKQNKVSR